MSHLNSLSTKKLEEHVKKGLDFKFAVMKEMKRRKSPRLEKVITKRLREMKNSKAYKELDFYKRFVDKMILWNKNQLKPK